MSIFPKVGYPTVTRSYGGLPNRKKQGVPRTPPDDPTALAYFGTIQGSQGIWEWVVWDYTTRHAAVAAVPTWAVGLLRSSRVQNYVMYGPYSHYGLALWAAESPNEFKNVSKDIKLCQEQLYSTWFYCTHQNPEPQRHGYAKCMHKKRARTM